MTEQGPKPIEPRIAVSNLSADLNKANTRRAGIATAVALTTVISLNGFAHALEQSPEPSFTPGTQEPCPVNYHPKGSIVGDLASLTPDASFNPEATPTATVEVSPIPSITPIESISPEASTSPDANIEVVDQTTGEIIICIPDEVAVEATASPEYDIDDFSIKTLLETKNKKITKEEFEEVITENAQQLNEYFASKGYTWTKKEQIKFHMDNVNMGLRDPNFFQAKGVLAPTVAYYEKLAEETAENGEFDQAIAFKIVAQAYRGVALKYMIFEKNVKDPEEAFDKYILKKYEENSY